MSWNLMAKSRQDGEVVEDERDRQLMLVMRNSRAGALYLWCGDLNVFAKSIPACFNVLSGWRARHMLSG